MLLGPMIVFVGLAGKHPQAVEHQLAPVLAHAHVKTRAIAPHDLAALARHTDASAEVVRDLHVGGVIGGAVIESGGALTLRVVVYDGTGHMRSLGETPLAGRTMTKDELEVVGENLEQELADLAPAATAPPPSDAPDPVSPWDESTAPSAAAAPPAAETPAAPSPAPEATSPASGDAVSLDDVAALNASGEAADTAPAPTTSSSGLGLMASAGLGIAGRSFSAPTSVMGYSASPVGTLHLAAGITPIGHLTVGAMAEKAIDMSSSVGQASAATSMSRWEVTASYAFHAGRLALAPVIGYGQRDFSIASSSDDRSPDTSYGYLLGGATAELPIKSRVIVRALVAFEPVTGGAEPTAMTYGPATRWAFDAGAGVDVRIISHLVARAAFDYQQFAWSWAAAGTRSAASATDAYPTGTLSLAAEY